MKTTGLFNDPTLKVKKKFAGIFSVELDEVHARKWNAERVSFFQSVILQRAQGVNNYAQIQKRVLFLIDLWDRGASDKLMKDTYGGTSLNVFKPCPEEEIKRSRTVFCDSV